MARCPTSVDVAATMRVTIVRLPSRCALRLAIGVCVGAMAAPARGAAPAAMKLVAPPAPASAPAPAPGPVSATGGDSLAALIAALEMRDRLRAEADDAVRRADDIARVEPALDDAEQQFA